MFRNLRFLMIANTYAAAKEQREYNTLNQLKRIYAFQAGPVASMDLNYNYTAGTNTGQISA